MRPILYSFIIGAILGFLIAAMLLIPGDRQLTEDQSDKLVDYIINEWTAPRITELVAGSVPVLELPDARPAYFPDTVRALARRIDSVYHIPQGVTLAQWALESRFGTSSLGLRNYFGHTFAAVKRYMDEPRCATRREQTVMNGQLTLARLVSFAEYRTIAQCFETHGRYLSQSALYRNAFKQNSPENFCRALAKAGYATDPEYALKLIIIMRRYHLN